MKLRLLTALCSASAIFCMPEASDPTQGAVFKTLPATKLDIKINPADEIKTSDSYLDRPCITPGSDLDKVSKVGKGTESVLSYAANPNFICGNETGVFHASTGIQSGITSIGGAVSSHGLSGGLTSHFMPSGYAGTTLTAGASTMPESVTSVGVLAQSTFDHQSNFTSAGLRGQIGHSNDTFKMSAHAGPSFSSGGAGFGGGFSLGFKF